MKYRIVTTFWYDEDDAGLLSRLERLFRLEFFQTTILRPKSDRLSPTGQNLRQLLQPDGYRTSDLRFVVSRGKKSLRGTLHLTRNSPWTPPGFTSFLALNFSLCDAYKGGPFHNVDELREILLACVQVGPSPMGFAETADESDEQNTANFQRFQSIDSMTVPVSIDWVSVLHNDVVARMGADLMDAAAAADVRAGRQGDYWWIILTEEPFSLLKEDHVQGVRAMKAAVGLDAVHARFPRP